MFSDFSEPNDNKNAALRNRPPAVAGKFYSNKPDILYNELQKLFESVNSKPDDNLAALIAPHAGYVFSGKTAAAAYSRINPNKTYQNVFILATSHHITFDGASVYSCGHYNMPLGEVKVNTEIAQSLIDTHTCFTYNCEAHKYEHSIEVQLPFLQYVFKNNFKIIPIIIGTSAPNTIETIAKALAPFFNNDNLFVVSTDFSHYPSYETANTIDNETINAILDNNAKKLYDIINANEKKQHNNLSTCLCGWSAVLCLLNITEKKTDISIEKIDYCNSGDTVYGEKDRVVGYAAISFSHNTSADEFSLNTQEQNQLLALAKKSLREYIIEGIIEDLSPNNFTSTLQKPYGVFISLYNKDTLRGCIGCLESNKPLYENIQQMTLTAATKDTRFKKISKEELDNIRIEISVLSPLKRIYSPDEIVIGKHGIYIKKGMYSGTFLPQVAAQTNWSAEEFLMHCAKNKAGLNENEWQSAELYIYTAFVFHN